MPLDCYATFRICTICEKNRIRLRRDSNLMKLFLASRPLEFVAIDILGEIIKTLRGNRFLLGITDRYSKLVRTVPLAKITAIEVANAFVPNWVLVYSPPVSLLSDNGTKIIAKFFQHVCLIFGLENLFTTTYNPQCDGQVKRFNRTFLDELRHYVADTRIIGIGIRTQSLSSTIPKCTGSRSSHRSSSCFSDRRIL